MKKFIVFALTLITLFSLTACVLPSPSSESKEEESIATEQIADVTAWNEAIYLNGVDYEVNFTTAVTTFGVTTEQIIVCKYVGDDNYQKSINLLDVFEVYFEKDGEKYYQYEASEGVWAKEEISAQEYDENLMIGKMAQLFKYEDFTYDEEKEAYYCAKVVTETGVELLENYIYFKDGKVAKLTSMQKEVDPSLEIEIVTNFTVIYNYDNIEFSLPTEESEKTVITTQEEWLAIVDVKGSAIAHYVVSDRGEYDIIRNGDIVYQGDLNEYYVKDGEKFYNYRFDESESVWKKTEIDESTYLVFSNLSFASLFSFSDVIYSAEKDAYVCQSKEDGSVIFEDFELRIKDGKLYEIKFTLVTEEIESECVITYDLDNVPEIVLPEGAIEN